jgi:hypothetical protein
MNKNFKRKSKEKIRLLRGNLRNPRRKLMVFKAGPVLEDGITVNELGGKAGRSPGKVRADP